MTEAQWLDYSAKLRTRPLMPDFAMRDMTQEDRRAIYRFVRSLGPAGSRRRRTCRRVRTRRPPYFDLVLPAGPAGGRSRRGAQRNPERGVPQAGLSRSAPVLGCAGLKPYNSGTD